MLSDNSLKFLTTIPICMAVIIVFSLVTILPLYYAGYGPEKDKIGNYEEGKCLVTNHSGPITDICYRNCNCVCVPSGKGGCTMTCQRCEYDCYDGFVLVQLNTTNDETYNTKIQTSNDVGSTVSVLKKFEKYPIGTIHTCYYDNTDPNDVVFNINYTRLRGTLAGIIIFAVITGYCCIALLALCILTGLGIYSDIKPIDKENSPHENRDV